MSIVVSIDGHKKRTFLKFVELFNFAVVEGDVAGNPALLSFDDPSLLGRFIGLKVRQSDSNHYSSNELDISVRSLFNAVADGNGMSPAFELIEALVNDDFMSRSAVSLGFSAEDLLFSEPLQDWASCFVEGTYFNVDFPAVPAGMSVISVVGVFLCFEDYYDNGQKLYLNYKHK